MRGFRSWIAAYDVTPLGRLLLGVLLVAVALAAIGPSSLQAPAFAVGILLCVLLLAGSLSGGSMGRSTKSLQDRRAEFGPTRRDTSEGGEAQGGDAELWQRERERREGRAG